MTSSEAKQAIDPRQLLDLLSDFVGSLAAHPSAVESLQSVCERLVSFLDVRAIGVSHVEDGHLRLVAYTDARIPGQHQAEDEQRSGPDIEAVARVEALSIEDLNDGSAAERWPAYTRHALATGWRSMAHLPIFGTTHVSGVLSLYHDQTRRWVELNLAMARLIVELAELYGADWIEIQKHKDVSAQLQQALDSRVVIEQAKGILAQAYGISVTEAFERLRVHARSRNAKLQAVAEAVVNLGLRL